MKYPAQIFLQLVCSPHLKCWRTPTRAARVITKVLTDLGRTGVYFDDGGPTLASERLRSEVPDDCCR